MAPSKGTLAQLQVVAAESVADSNKATATDACRKYRIS
jgi:hypothetical protein